MLTAKSALVDIFKQIGYLQPRVIIKMLKQKFFSFFSIIFHDNLLNQLFAVTDKDIIPQQAEKSSKFEK